MLGVVRYVDSIVTIPYSTARWTRPAALEGDCSCAIAVLSF